MDRFIVLVLKEWNLLIKVLKSNMDRFIAGTIMWTSNLKELFKIQYG